MKGERNASWCGTKRRLASSDPYHGEENRVLRLDGAPGDTRRQLDLIGSG
jgi:hypothetical protein